MRDADNRAMTFSLVSLMSTLQHTLAADWMRTSLSNELACRMN
jgi:hypothetical protein